MDCLVSIEAITKIPLERSKTKLEKYIVKSSFRFSLEPPTKKDIYFLKYPIYIVENEKEGQIYPHRSKSNHTNYNATVANIVSEIIREERGDAV